MKLFFKIILFIVCTSFSGITINNDDCKVLLPELSKKYQGECKKGLAHGFGKAWGETDYYEGNFKKGLPDGYGTYIWGNGSKYIGDFSKGLMDGAGELRIKGASEEEHKKGYFKKGEYIGEYKYPYKVISNLGIRKIDFREDKVTANEVRITVYSNGQKITPNLSISDDNNTTVENRNGAVLTNVIFPLKRVQVSFQVETFSYKAVFDIYKKGNWEVSLFL